MVEATRVGTIFAHDAKAANRWHRQVQRKANPGRPAGLTGVALERAIMGIAAIFPNNVIRQAAA